MAESANVDRVPRRAGLVEIFDNSGVERIAGAGARNEYNLGLLPSIVIRERIGRADQGGGG